MCNVLCLCLNDLVIGLLMGIVGHKVDSATE